MIRVPQVRLVDAQGEARGIVPTREAIRLAEEAVLDLVEVAPNADPPVCRIMDYGKFKYEKAKKTKEAKKKQHVVHLKEIKMSPTTGEHDYHYKMEHAREFILKNDRVKATVVFRGREMAHMEFGRRLLDKMTQDLTDISGIEVHAKIEGRNMISIFVPDRDKIKQHLHRLDLERKRAETEEATRKLLEEQQARDQQQTQSPQ